jgi:hypothetical protein
MFFETDSIDLKPKNTQRPNQVDDAKAPEG